MKNHILALLILSVAGTLSRAEAAPPVIMKIEGSLYEKDLFSNGWQSTPISLLGSDISTSYQLSAIGRADTGYYDGNNNYEVQAANGTVVISRDISLTFYHTLFALDFTHNTLGSRNSLVFYVLGEPGTEYSYSINDTVSFTSDGPGTSYEDIAYTSPGWLFDFRVHDNSGATLDPVTGSGFSTGDILIYQGQTYSAVKVTPETSGNVQFGYSGAYNFPPVTTGTLQSTFSMTVNNLSAIPEPSTYAALAGLGALSAALFRRRQQRPLK
jgi:hypothetical protein